MVAPLLPPTSTLCVEQTAAPSEVAVQFPGGIRLSATAGFGKGDLSEIVNSALGSANAALAPLQPELLLVDVAVKMLDAVKAAPKLLTEGPGPLLKAIPDLALAVDKVVSALVPPLPIIVLVRDLLLLIVNGLLGYRQKVSALSAKSARIAAAAARADDPLLPAAVRASLLSVVGCAEENLAVELANLNAGMAPINRILMIINALLHLVNLPCIPTVAGAGAASEEALAPLDDALAFMQKAISAIPIGSGAELPPIPGPTDPC